MIRKQVGGSPLGSQSQATTLGFWRLTAERMSTLQPEQLIRAGPAWLRSWQALCEACFAVSACEPPMAASLAQT